MYILTLGRSFPKKKTGMRGIFEFEQARALKNAGHKSIYAFCDTRSIMVMREYGEVRFSVEGLNVYGFHSPNIGLPRTIFSAMRKKIVRRILEQVIEREGIPDVVHVHFPLITLTDDIWDMLKGLNRPIVVTEHWTRVQTKQIEGFRQQLLKKIVEESNRTICVGDPLKESVLELTNTNRTIEVIPNMVSPLFYYDDNSIGSNSNQFEFISIGRLVEVKGFDIVINAFTKAFKDNKNVKLNIVGGGPLYEKLKMQINKLEMNNQISMLGYLNREDTAKQLRKSNAFVSGSKLETFGVPFIEAMSCGIPVIGMSGSPLDKYINDMNGIQFNDLNSLSEAFKEMYQKKYNKEEIAQYAEDIFSEKAVVKKILEVYQKL